MAFIQTSWFPSFRLHITVYHLTFFLIRFSPRSPETLYSLGSSFTHLFLHLFSFLPTSKSVISKPFFLFFFFNLTNSGLFVYLFIYLFIYLFMAVLGLRFCARAFSSCGKWGPLFITVRGPLTIAASLVVEHRLQSRRLSNCGSRA